MQNLRANTEKLKSIKPFAFMAQGDITAFAVFLRWYPIVRETTTGVAAWVHFLKLASEEHDLSSINSWHQRANPKGDFADLMRRRICGDPSRRRAR